MNNSETNQTNNNLSALRVDVAAIIDVLKVTVDKLICVQISILPMCEHRHLRGYKSSCCIAWLFLFIEIAISLLIIVAYCFPVNAQNDHHRENIARYIVTIWITAAYLVFILCAEMINILIIGIYTLIYHRRQQQLKEINKYNPDALNNRAEDLNSTSYHFRGTTRRVNRHMRWQNYKLTIFILNYLINFIY
ncbi:unnamed protein product [Rotaria sordida]|uniref:V-SNARE coiled-coil homology domain-containing protein n=1 Tax=Rotaria sordida TaxID=392033 RepID=A0A819DX53_9BILA|nr:unnamed protein product [Rotaria sordida]